MAEENGKNSKARNIIKVGLEITGAAIVGFLITWGAMTNSVDSLKTQLKDVSDWKAAHSVQQAGKEATLATKLDNLEKILTEMREEQKQNMKEIREELKKKRDK